MTNSVNGNILKALLLHMRELELVLDIPVAYPNIMFPADGSEKPSRFIRIDFIPNRTDTLSIGVGSHRSQGLFQASIYWESGTGLVEANDVAGQIVQHFDKGTILDSDTVRIKIQDKPWVARDMQEGDRVQIPVTIPYVSFNK